MSKTDNAIGAIVGIPELRAQLEAMSKGLYSEEVARIYLAAARRIRDAAKRQAPVSKWPIVSRWGGKLGRVQRRPPGALRQAIIAFDLSRKRKEFGPAAIAQVNLFKGRNRAPHAHLVEWGTQGVRRSKSGKLMPFPAMGGARWIYTGTVQPMPANPFFERAVSIAGAAALEAARRANLRILEDAGVKS